jgi:hypothetical protein
MCAAPIKLMRTVLPTSVVVSAPTTTVTTTSTTPSRTSASISGGVLASVAAGATVSGTLTMAKSFMLQEAIVTYPTRVRLYSTATAQAADLLRPYTVPIATGTQHCMICDLYLNTVASLTWLMSPAAEGSNLDTITATIYYAVTNIDTVTRSMAVAFTFLPMEN